MAELLRRVDNFVKVKDEEDGRPVDRWRSPDVLPVLPKNRNFGTGDYASYWASGAVSAGFWSMGGTGIANGLNAGMSVGAILIGSVVCSLVAYACGEPGLKYHLGFPMMSRATFGMYGSYFAVTIKCFTNLLYCGIQSYWGGLSVHVILASIFPSYHHMPNTLPASANITTANLIGTIIYVLIFWGVMLIQPYKLNKFFRVSFIAAVITIVAMFIWAMAANKGAGNIVSPDTSLSPAEKFFVMIQLTCTLCGSFTGASIRHSDWSRYATERKATRLGMWLVCPIALTCTAMCGVFVTSAAREMYGEAIWQPITLLLHIQKVDYSAAARAGTFFGGLGWFLSQLAVNVSLNSVSAGMDLTAVAPKYLNARRGGLMLGFIGLAVCPWNYVNSASTFTTVLSSFGLFISPLIGIYMADFWVVRKKAWNVPDLFIGSKESTYWYSAGFNLRAFSVWIFIIWPSLPGFIMAINGTDIGLSWTRIFQITFFVGMIGGFVLYCLVCYIFPIPNATVDRDYDWSAEGIEDVIMGHQVSDEEKGAGNVGVTPADKSDSASTK